MIGGDNNHYTNGDIIKKVNEIHNTKINVFNRYFKRVYFKCGHYLFLMISSSRREEILNIITPILNIKKYYTHIKIYYTKRKCLGSRNETRLYYLNEINYI